LCVEPREYVAEESLLAVVALAVTLEAELRNVDLAPPCHRYGLFDVVLEFVGVGRAVPVDRDVVDLLRRGSASSGKIPSGTNAACALRKEQGQPVQTHASVPRAGDCGRDQANLVAVRSDVLVPTTDGIGHRQTSAVVVRRIEVGLTGDCQQMPTILVKLA